MSLMLQPDGAEARVFWLRRNQCIGMLDLLSRLAVQQGVAVQPIGRPVQQGGAPAPTSAFDDTPPEDLHGIRLRQVGGSTRLQFLFAEGAMGLRLDQKVLVNLLESTGMQAELAGWDPAAGVARLRAQRQERAERVH